MPCPRNAPSPYVPRAATDTVLYGVVQAELEPFLAAARAAEVALPPYVEAALRAFLRCGVLACGFGRARCVVCGFDRLVPFSCKRRGVCASCGGRRMSETAAEQVTRLWPSVPVRQWVLSLPWPLRLPVARDPSLLTKVSRIFFEAVRDLLRQRAAGVAGADEGARREIGAVTSGLAEPQVGRLRRRSASRCGVVIARNPLRMPSRSLLAALASPRRNSTTLWSGESLVQRFGSALNLNPHLHVLVADGVFLCREDGSSPRFVPTPPPTRSELAAVLRTVAARVARIQKVGADDDLGPLRSVAAARGTFTRMRDAEEADGPALREPEEPGRASHRGGRRARRLQPARGGARRCGRSHGAGAAASLRGAPGGVRRAGGAARGRRGDVPAQDAATQRRDASGDAAGGVSRAPGGAHPAAALSVGALPRRFCAELPVAWGDCSGAATGASPRPWARACLGRALRGRGVGGRGERGRLLDPLGLGDAAAPCVGRRRARLPALRGQDALHRRHPRPRVIERILLHLKLPHEPPRAARARDPC
jgi:hypothetical protein